MFFLLLLVFSIMAGVQSNSPDYGSGSGCFTERFIFFKDIRGYKKKNFKYDELFPDVEPDDKFFGVSPEMIYNRKVEISDGSELVSKPKTEGNRFYDDVALIIGAVSTLVTAMLILFLLSFVILSSCRRRRAEIRRIKAEKMKNDGFLSFPSTSSVLESGNLPKIEFTFEMDKNLLKRQKPKVATEKSFVKCNAKPKLPPKQRKKAEESAKNADLRNEDFEINHFSQKKNSDFPFGRNYVLPMTKETIITEAEVHPPPREEIV